MRFIVLLFFILIYAASSRAQEPLCQDLKSLTETYRVCWNSTYKGWFSANCLEKKCKAIELLEKHKAHKLKMPPTKDSRNPAAQLCHQLKLKVEILRDQQGNEQSFCIFKDKSLVDANAVEGGTL